MAVPKCCEGCLKWKQFGRDCWVYWEKKRECTQKIENAEQMMVLQ